VLKCSKHLANFEFRRKHDTTYRHHWIIQEANLAFQDYVSIYFTLERGTEALEFHLEGRKN